MKRNVLALATFLLLPFALLAQSSLTIFSEDGYKFYLILNGQRQNNVPMTNIHIDGLSQPFYSTKIIFEDASKPEISQNIPTTDPETNAFADVTYKIKTTKDGKLKMRYFSATPAVPNYVAPPDMYVMHYGQPAPPPPPGMGSTTVTQTTTTTTGAPMGNGGVSFSVGGAGVNMNVNISDPTMGGGTVHQSTTTTTTYSDGGYVDNGYRDAPPPPRGNAPRGGNGCRACMDANSFRSAKETISKASFDDTKLSTAKTILASNCMNTDQIMQICNLFSFEANKLEFAKHAYGRTTDPNNYFKVANIFTFDGSRTELNEYISGH